MTLFARCVPFLFIVLLTLDGVAAQAESEQSHLVEIGVENSIYSDVLDEHRQFWIHLPNHGDLDSDHRYPVIYLLDGGVHLGGLAMIQEYYNYFRLPEMIVVAISNRTNRTRDLTTSVVELRRGASVDASGGAEAFTRFIAEELIPHIDSRYPTANHRTLIGHSYAGLFTINALIRHRDLFTNFIAIDPSLDWDAQRLLHEATTALRQGGFDGKGLFVSVANEIIRFSDTLSIDDVASDTTEFSIGIRSMLEFVDVAAATTESSGLNFSWSFYEKDIHGSVPLASMRDGLVFLYDWWELERPSKYNDPSTPTEELVSLVRTRTQSLTENMGYPIAMEEELLTMLGYMSLDMGQADKAHALFELAVEYYPLSPDAHLAMADYFESQSDSERALSHAQRAFELSGSDEHRTRVEALTDQR